MFVGAPFADVAPNAQTGHPCVVLPYKFDVPVPQGGGARPAGTPPVAAPELKAQPICGVIVGALYNDDSLLGVAHQVQLETNVHARRPTI